MNRVLIIGRHGQVTTYLQRVLASDYTVVVAGREQVDLLKLDQIQAALADIKPDLIINPAAFTAVDLAEEQMDQAFTINRDAVAEIAAYAQRTNTPLIHFSTDYVFDGESATPYLESDKPNPTGVYGQSKLEGEQAVLDSGAPALILRTAWVYSNHGKNFYNTMLALAKTRTELSVVADQIGAPTYAGSIAAATESLVDIIRQQGGITHEQSGIYHFSCGGETSWYEFAKALFRANDIASMTVNPISTAEYPTPAKRPPFSKLDGSKLAAVFKFSLPSWQHALNDCAAETRAA